MIPTLMSIERHYRETSDTFTIDLMAPDGVGQFHFAPGQFNMIGVLGVGEVPISISGDAGNSKTLIHTIREVGAATRAIRQAPKGALLGVRGPFGTAWPVTEAEGQDVVLVAGGIGLAPLRPVIYHVMHNREKYGQFYVLYGTRTPEDILFLKEIGKWRSNFAVEMMVTVDRGNPSWRGNVGVVTHLVARAGFNPNRTVAMVCGPELMMRFAVQELENRGVPESSIYVSMEKNMKCGIGLCGHCQLRSEFICKDGPVYPLDKIEPLMGIREL